MHIYSQSIQGLQTNGRDNKPHTWFDVSHDHSSVQVRFSAHKIINLERVRF